MITQFKSKHEDIGHFLEGNIITLRTLYKLKTVHKEDVIYGLSNHYVAVYMTMIERDLVKEIESIFPKKRLEMISAISEDMKIMDPLMMKVEQEKVKDSIIKGIKKIIGKSPLTEFFKDTSEPNKPNNNEFAA